MRLRLLGLLMLLLPGIALSSVSFGRTAENHGSKVKHGWQVVNTSALRRQTQDMYALLYAIKGSAYGGSWGGGFCALRRR